MENAPGEMFLKNFHLGFVIMLTLSRECYERLSERIAKIHPSLSEIGSVIASCIAYVFTRNR